MAEPNSEFIDKAKQVIISALRRAVVIDYVNHRGERSHRTVVPGAIRWGSNEWHTEEQWLMEALDLDKGLNRTFAMKDVHSWRPDDSGVRIEDIRKVEKRPKEE